MAIQMPYGKQQFLDAAGISLALGSVTFYVPGTTTPKDTWQDEGQTTLNANPIALDASGYAIIYGSGSYRQIVKDILGNTLWDQVVDAYDAETLGVTKASLAATNGPSLLGWKRPDTGAVATDLLTKLLVAPRTPIDFGLLGNWTSGVTTNDAPQLQAMLNAAAAGRKGVMPLQDGIFYLTSQLAIPLNCGIDGGLSAGEPSDQPFGSKRATFICGPGGSVLCNHGSTLRNVNVIAAPCATQPTSAASANATIAAFSSQGVVVNGHDVLLDHVTVVGFATGIYSSGFERLTVEGARIDCTNGIEITNSTDTSRINDAQIWPFWSVHLFSDLSTLQRSGIGINIHDTADGVLVSEPLVYGYTVGINIQNVYAVKISDFWIDGVASLQGTQHGTGFKTSGTVKNCGLSNGHVDSQETNYSFGHTVNPGVVMTGCTGGQFTGQQVALGAGSGGNIVNFQSIGGLAGCITEFNVLSGVGPWDIGFIKVQNSAAPVLFAFQTPGDASNIRTSHIFVATGPASDRAVGEYITNGIPAANPVNGGYLYVDAGALKYRGSSGTVTTIAPA